MLSNRSSRPTGFAGARALAPFAVAVLVVCGAVRPARAADAPGIDRLNKQGLDAFDGLNFDQAKTLLEKAISEGEASGLEHDPSVARAHLDLGMLLIAGFQKRDEAMEQFKAALAIQPGIRAPAGLFNPEVQAAFDEAKASVKSDQEAAVTALAPQQPERPVVVRRAKPKAKETSEKEEDSGAGIPGFYLGLGFGSGGGIAKGDLDTNKDLYQHGVLDNSWSGGFATSRLGHLTIDAGYFVSRDFLLSVEGRIQFVSGTSTVVSTPSCQPSCSAPSTGIAVLAKATHFFASDGLRPFVQGGLGGGAIRQVVKLNVTPDADGSTHCGSDGMGACVDTVTGGPFLIAVGGGLAYQMGSLALIGSLVSNIGIPKFMLNFDLTLGVGLSL